MLPKFPKDYIFIESFQYDLTKNKSMFRFQHKKFDIMLDIIERKTPTDSGEDAYYYYVYFTPYDKKFDSRNSSTVDCLRDRHPDSIGEQEYNLALLSVYGK